MCRLDTCGSGGPEGGGVRSWVGLGDGGLGSRIPVMDLTPRSTSISGARALIMGRRSSHCRVCSFGMWAGWSLRHQKKVLTWKTRTHFAPSPTRGRLTKNRGRRVGKQNEPGNPKASGQKANLETRTKTQRKSDTGPRKRKNREGGRGQKAGRGERTNSQVENPELSLSQNGYGYKYIYI